jgi:hypothetical protein
MAINIVGLFDEITTYVKDIDVNQDGEHLWDNYQQVTAFLMRLTEIRNDLAWEEINGKSAMEAKKFRTMIIDPTVERFEQVAAYESRKITAKGIEAQLGK